MHKTGQLEAYIYIYIMWQERRTTERRCEMRTQIWELGDIREKRGEANYGACERVDPRPEKSMREAKYANICTNWKEMTKLD